METGRVVSVGIAAWNAEANIGAILRAVLLQCEESVRISEIIVHSDHSTDRTIAIARECADPRLKVVDHARRRGFAAAVSSMLEAFTGDALVLLNDDIRIVDDKFIEKIVMPVFRKRADFASANLQPLPPRGFVERASVSVFRVWERIRESIPERDNVFTCDGAAMCLSARFARSINLPADTAQAGNVDAFLYFFCVGAGLRYVHASNAVAWFRSPASIRDYVARNIRNDSQRPLLEKQFGAMAAKAFSIPRGLYWKSVAREIRDNPIGALFVFFAGLYVRANARHAARNASPTWEVVKSSKNLD
jgi:glycosyltransferase involved in cell wall biosynthesis